VTLRVHASDPGALLEATFLRIERERMHGVPLLNPALRVQTAHVEPWQGRWLAALVTPWFLNLVLLPRDPARWQPAREGERVFHHFAAGDFAFLASAEPELGEFQACSLVSPMAGFTSQESALATARAAVAMLHVKPQPEAAPAPSATAAPPPPPRRVFLLGRG